MIVIGLTGGLAAGKSQAAKILKKMGAVVFDADESARKALRQGSPAYKAAVKLFGSRFVGKKGIDRTALARHVFANPSELKKLNTLVHPMVIMEALDLMDRTKRRKGLLVMDVPLLFESKMDNLVDATVLVRASKPTVIRRAAGKGMDAALANKILAAQWPAEKKAKLADYVIDNDGSVAKLEKRLKETVAKIRAAETV